MASRSRYTPCVVGFLTYLLFVTSPVCSNEREADGAYSPREKEHHIHKHGDNDEEYHHEAILGNEQLHQEFHHQPPEQSRARLLQLAAGHDLDNDGLISSEELRQWIYGSFQDLNSEDALNRFQDVDQDGDGFATWTEHLSDTWGLANDENLLHSEEYKDELVMIKEEELLFKAADRDEDGKLSQEEFLAFERPEQYDYMQPMVIKRTKDAKDANGDGFIDFHEYIVDILPGYKKTLNQDEREIFTSEKERFETLFDLDHDGHLNDTEIFHWLIPDDNATAVSEAEHIMDKADSDKNGQLSPDEMAEHYQVFVGSEITDYGNSLTNEEEDRHQEL